MEIAQALLTFIAIVIGIFIIGIIVLYLLNDNHSIKNVCMNCKHYDFGTECCWKKKNRVSTDPRYTSCDNFKKGKMNAYISKSLNLMQEK